MSHGFIVLRVNLRWFLTSWWNGFSLFASGFATVFFGLTAVDRFFSLSRVPREVSAFVMVVLFAVSGNLVSCGVFASGTRSRRSWLQKKPSNDTKIVFQDMDPYGRHAIFEERSFGKTPRASGFR